MKRGARIFFILLVGLLLFSVALFFYGGINGSSITGNSVFSAKEVHVSGIEVSEDENFDATSGVSGNAIFNENSNNPLEQIVDFVAGFFDGSQTQSNQVLLAPPEAMTTASRTNCVAPCAVFFDAVNGNGGTSTLGSSYSFHDIDYSWNFGDSSAGTWNTDGESKNIAKGAIAAHVFETPGTYDVTLTQKNQAGETAEFTQTITVADPDVVFANTNTVCISNTNNFADCPSGAEQRNVTSLSEVQSSVASNKRILFRRGETWTANNNGQDSGAVEIDAAGPGIIGTFGTGSKPVINQVGIGHVFEFQDTASDWRVVDFTLNGNNVNSYNSAVGMSAGSVNALVMRVDASGTFKGGISNPWGSPSSLQFIVDSSFNNVGATSEGGSNNIGLTGSRLVLLGNTAIGVQHNNEHIVRVFHFNKLIISHNNFQNPMTSKHVLKLHKDKAFSYPFSQYSIVSDNYLKHTVWTVGIGPQDHLSNELVMDVLVERNTIYGGSPLIFWAQNSTARNNIILGNNVPGDFYGITVERRGIEPISSGISIYDNTIYHPYNSVGTLYEFRGIFVDLGTNITVKNNLISAPNWENHPAKKFGVNNLTSIVESNNLFLDNPGFVNPGTDFHVQSGSVAIEGGTPVPVFDDYDGVLRPQGANWDVGAYELLGGSSGGSDTMTTASRTSCVAPCGVFFDAVNAGSPAWTSGVIQPSDGDYASFDYQWNFGDASSGSWTTGRQNPDGSYPSKNSATGYVSAHVFETPGAYTVTLNVTDTAGVVTSYTQQIVVTDPNVIFSGANTRCVSTSGNFAGCPSGTPVGNQITSSDLSAQITWVNGASGRRLLFRSGENWATTATQYLTIAGPSMIGSYGSGARPILTLTTAGEMFVMDPTTDCYNANSGSAVDWRFVDLDIRGISSDNGLSCRNNNTLTLRTRFSGFSTGIGDRGHLANGLFVFDSEFIDLVEYGIYSNRGGASQPITRSAILGSHFDNIIGPPSPAPSPNGEHLIRSHTYKALISNNLLERPAQNKHMIRLSGPTQPQESAYSIVADNILNSDIGIAMMDVGPPDSVELTPVHDVVIERNVYLTPNGVGTAMHSRGASRITVRNNLIMSSHAIETSDLEFPFSDWKIYNNAFHYSGTGASAFLNMNVGGASNWRVFNNIISMPNTNNVNSFAIYSPNNPVSSFVSNNNIWHIPLMSDPIAVGGNFWTFAQWRAQGQDAQGMGPNVNIGFVNSAAGNLHLQSTSPAINNGTNLITAGVRKDYDLVSRPQGAGFDVGAFEYLSGVIPQPFNYSLSTNPTSTTLERGKSVVISINANLLSGNTMPVTLSASGLPTGVTAVFTPTVCNPTCTSQLNLSASMAATPALTNILISGTNGSLVKTTSVALTVINPLPFNYSISVNPTSGTVVNGSSIQASVSSTLVSGTAMPITFSASGLPSGTSVVFSPTSCSPTCSSIMNITTSVNTPLGTSNILVSATNGSLVRTAPYSLTVSTPSSCQTSLGSWQNVPFTVQTGTFTAEFDSTPNNHPMDGVIGFSNGAADAYTDLAPIIRFNPNGGQVIDVRNGADYAALVPLNYVAGTSYHFRMVVNVSAKTYSVYVTPQGQSEITLATNYAFRSDQAAVTQLNNVGFISALGSNSFCNFQISSAPSNLPPVVSVISHNALDVNSTKSGLQVYNGTIVTYSGTVSDPDGNNVVWRWLYKINGGAENQYGFGTFPPAQVVDVVFPYGQMAVNYTWILRGNDSVLSAQSTLDVEVVMQSSGAQPSCDLTSASWSANNVTNGTQVTMSVSGTNCAGQNINFTIFEDDPAFDDLIVSTVATYPSTTWTAVWTYLGDDDIGGDERDYYFRAFPTSNASDVVTSGILDVNQTNIVQTGGEVQAIINASRTSCVAPCGVFFDASSTTGLANNDFLNAHFGWDFGDSLAGTWTTTGLEKNKATGFIATHVYESPGTYTVQMHTTDVNGNEADAAPLVITVQNPEAVFSGASTSCVSATGSFSGCPAGAQNSTDIVSQIAWVNGGANRRLLLHRGETFPVSGFRLDADGQHVLGAYGTGNDPNLVFNQNAAPNHGVSLPIGGDGWTVMDIEITGSIPPTIQTEGNHFTGLRLNIHDSGWVGLGLFGNNPVVADSSVVNNGYFSVYSEAHNSGIMGSRIDQVRLASVYGGSSTSLNNFYVAHNHIDASRPDPSSGIKWHARRGVITDNIITNGGERISMGNSGDPPGTLWNENLGTVLIERNRLLRLNVSKGGGSIGVADNSNVVIRNNLVYELGGFGAEVHSQPFIANINIYNNAVYQNVLGGSNTDNGNFFILGTNVLNTSVFNNLFVLPSTSSQCGPVNGCPYLNMIHATDLSTLRMNNNLYYLPQIPILIRYNGASQTLAQWQAAGFDTNSIILNPNVISVDPTSSDFLKIPSNSPAKDSGTQVPVFDDFEGTLRPQGAGFDIGAYEFISGGADTQSPQFSNVNVQPSSPSTYSASQNYIFNVTWTDNAGVQNVRLVFNGTNYTMSANGNIYSRTLSNLGAGSYSYSFAANDSAGNNNQTSSSSYVINQATPILNVGSSAGLNFVYPTSTILSGTGCPSGVTCTLHRNNVAIANPTTATLGAGSYVVKYNSTANQNWTSSSTQNTVVVTQSSPITSVLVIPSSPIVYPSVSNFSCSNSAQLPTTLFVNGVDKSSEKGINLVRGAGTYVLNCSSVGNQNYSASSQQINYLVNQATAGLSLTFSPSNSVTQGTQTTVNGTGCPVGLTCTLRRNGVVVSNPDIQTLSTATYVYNYSTNGNQNYSSGEAIGNLIISSLPTFSLSVSKSGTGSGTVSSSPSGISCGADCSEVYTQGTLVNLTATPSAGSAFAGWSGDCSGIGSCQVSMDLNRNVNAQFNVICVDSDGDGYNVTAGCGILDCNDGDANVNPSRSEICNGVDDNCAAGIDETGNALCTSYTGFGCVVAMCGGFAGCSYTENTAVCDNGLYCDGTEDCSISAIDLGDIDGCVAGTSVVCSDGYSCTTDSCDELSDSCSIPVPNDNLCSVGQTCDSLNFPAPSGCGFVENCQDSDGDGLFEYDSLTCTTGLDICAETNSTYFENNPGEVGNYLPSSTTFVVTSAVGIYEQSNYAIELANVGKIEFTQNVDLVTINDVGCFERIDLDNVSVLDMGQNRIYLDGNYLPGLNRPARLSFYNLNFVNPEVLRDGVECTVCSIVSYTGGVLNVDVPGFSTYTVAENDGDVNNNGDGNGNGGGGGGGGGRRGPKAVRQNQSTCNSSWSCSEWSECTNGIQNRTCSDINSCGNISDAPILSRECGLYAESGEEEQTITNPEPIKLFDMEKIIGLIVFLVLVGFIVLTIIVQRKRAFIEKRKELYKSVISTNYGDLR